jgi:RNA polymerase sigma factor (sigma-70 family)
VPGDGGALSGRTSHRAIPPFQGFLEANRTTVYRFLLAAVGPVEADDVFQDTFLAALRAYPRVHDPAGLDRWVLKIASRKAIDHHRGNARRPIPVEELPEVAGGSLAEPVDRRDPLWEAVATLPPRQRVALVLRHVLDRSYTDIAEAMGTTEEAARANVSYGTKRLRELMT